MYWKLFATAQCSPTIKSLYYIEKSEKTMGCRLRQNNTNTSEIYIGHPIYIYRTSSIYIGRPISISDIQYLYRTSDTQYPTSARARARARTGVSEFRYRYRTSDIDIGRKIYILDI